MSLSAVIIPPCMYQYTLKTMQDRQWWSARMLGHKTVQEPKKANYGYTALLFLWNILLIMVTSGRNMETIKLLSQQASRKQTSQCRMPRQHAWTHQTEQAVRQVSELISVGLPTSLSHMRGCIQYTPSKQCHLVWSLPILYNTTHTHLTP